MRALLSTTAVLVAPLSAAADVAITDGWARASVLASRPAAAYLTLVSDRDDQLVGVSSPAAGRVALHASRTDGGGRSRMVGIDVLDLPADTAVTLTPGGAHLMLMELPEKLEEGTFLPLVLTFASGARIETRVPVLGPGASGPHGDRR